MKKMIRIFKKFLICFLLLLVISLISCFGNNKETIDSIDLSKNDTDQNWINDKADDYYENTDSISSSYSETSRITPDSENNELVESSSLIVNENDPIESSDNNILETSCLNEAILYTININFDFHENLFFSKYDVSFIVDNKKIIDLAHGKNDNISIELSSGKHVITFRKADSDNPETTLDLVVNGEMSVNYRIECESDEIQILNPNYELQKLGIEYDLAICKTTENPNGISHYILIDFESELETNVTVYHGRKTGKYKRTVISSYHIEVETHEKWKTEYAEYVVEDNAVFLYPTEYNSEHKSTAQYSIIDSFPITEALFKGLAEKGSYYSIMEAITPKQ